VIKLCGKVEQEISTLDKNEQKEFLEEYKLHEPGLNILIRNAFNLLDLETYFTGGKTEVRAWTIKKGSSAPKAASAIHTDFEKGFIKAEIIKYKDLEKLGSEKLVKESGLSKLEGKDYIVQDGDCIFFHFNV
jgi:ribosome-binding ATPase YchF (GTP1/OBG family)